MSSSNNKMKGLLKGLRYISEIFENEKEPEMQIGLPTDVKHVAHIGWDGPSSAVKTAPSWMNEFKSSPANNGDAREEDPAKSASQDGISREGSRDQSSSATDMADVPKSSKRSSTSSTRNGSTGESAGKEKSDKPKHSKKSSKSSKETSETTTKPKKKPKDPKEQKEPKEPKDPTDSDNPKKSSRRKKSKDSVDESSRRSRTRDLDSGSESGSVAGIREEQLSTGSGYEENF